MSMGSEKAGCGGGAAEEMRGQGSPRSKVKFLCSYGGKILPRPSDGNLKYVGGETRVVAVSRNTSFSELMKKLSTLTESEMVLKYQIIPEELDALVSVKSDEDLKHMIEEHDRHESVGIPKLRTFLFPPGPVILENQVAPVDPQTIEQRYIEAINGVLRTPINTKLHPIIASRPSFSISACSSPKSDSPDGNSHDMAHPSEGCFPNSVYQSSRLSMHKVQSTPNMCSHHSTNNNLHYPQHSHPYYQSHSQYQQPHAYLTCRPPPQMPVDFQKSTGNESVPPGWGAPGHGVNQFYPARHNSGGGAGGGSRCSWYEDCGGFVCGYTDRASSVPQSPKKHRIRL